MNNRNALIIEDDEPTKFLLRSVVETEGWDCRHGDSMFDAMQHAAWATIIFLDLGLVGPSGVANIPRLRAANPSARIVVVTGDDQAHEAALEAGADAFLAKPFDVTELVDEMREAFVLDLRDDPADALPWFATAIA